MKAKNIGTVLSRKLSAVGVRTLADLERVGPTTVYKELSKKESGKHLPLCYYLYSLEGALKDLDWRDLSDEDKDRLKVELTM